jgi:hypothetical protein
LARIGQDKNAQILLRRIQIGIVTVIEKSVEVKIITYTLPVPLLGIAPSGKDTHCNIIYNHTHTIVTSMNNNNYKDRNKLKFLLGGK